MITTVAKPRVHVYRDFRLHSIIIIIIASLTKCVIRSLLCKPLAFSPAITRIWNTLSRTESACVESTTSHYNRGARGRTYTPADHRRMRLRGNVYRSSITDVKRRYTKHCNVNKMADSREIGPGKFITLLTL